MEFLGILAMGLWFVFPIVLFLAVRGADTSGEKIVEFEPHYRPSVRKFSPRYLPHFIQRLRHH